MSHMVECDQCRITGPRRIGTLAPKGWFYLEATDDTDPNNCLIIWACSQECANKLWKAGPGKLDLGV